MYIYCCHANMLQLVNAGPIHLIETEGSQEPVTELYPKPGESIPNPYTLSP
jgi:hypothetical protein